MMYATAQVPPARGPGVLTDHAAARSAQALGGTRAALNARRDAAKLSILVLQLAILLVIFHFWKVETPKFFRLCAVAFAGFVVHYLTPFELKKKVFLALSVAGAMVVLKEWDDRPLGNLLAYIGPLVMLGLLVPVSLAVYYILRLPINFWLRVAVLLALGAALGYERATNQFNLLPDAQWRVVGGILMFRIILYAYEVKVGRTPESLTDFLCYFFVLPNFYFTLFPVIDYATFKKGHYAEDVHRLAQRGINWMVRGTVQLLIYRIIYHTCVIGPDDVRSFASLCQWMFVQYLLYMRVSGWFHVIVGMLHLFGYKLPETNRRYFLAHSFTDFWRRINIYWKDFMVKVFYYPAYFRLRKRSERLALVAATVWVFFITCLLHSYQSFWITGAFTMKDTDVVFWTLLGLVVMITVLVESRRRPAAALPPALAVARRIVSTAVVFVAISMLWSLWSSYSVAEWWDTVTYWS